LPSLRNLQQRFLVIEQELGILGSDVIGQARRSRRSVEARDQIIHENPSADQRGMVLS
jgi:hypothetical protein